VALDDGVVIFPDAVDIVDDSALLDDATLFTGDDMDSFGEEVSTESLGAPVTAEALGPVLPVGASTPEEVRRVSEAGCIGLEDAVPAESWTGTPGVADWSLAAAV